MYVVTLLVDGVETDFKNDVRILVEDLEHASGGEVDLHLILTGEGLIVDVVEDDEVVATTCQSYDDLMEAAD